MELWIPSPASFPGSCSSRLRQFYPECSSGRRICQPLRMTLPASKPSEPALIQQSRIRAIGWQVLLLFESFTVLLGCWLLPALPKTSVQGRINVVLQPSLHFGAISQEVNLPVQWYEPAQPSSAAQLPACGNGPELTQLRENARAHRGGG